MAIGTGAVVDVFGTQDTVVSSGASVTTGNLSAASSAWTNDDDAPLLAIVFNGTMASTPASNRYITIFMYLLDVDGTTDENTPDSSNKRSPIASWELDSGQAGQVASFVRPLPNTVTSQQYGFVIENQGGVTLNSGWTLKVTPLSKNQHA